MTWIGWPLLGWFTASSVVALVFGRVAAARDLHEAPRTIAPVIDLSDRRALRLGEHHRPEQDGNGPATLPEPYLPM
ncbi:MULTISPECIES: hypothetical protein [Rhodococcus]|uniref:Uncharacterized protein n=1 Tax=Rhodococcus rhodochrous TaxID=1829 RepID=A0AAW4XBR0_RHORH|nr:MULTISPECIES: hypothetical protein [Rhodococcus]MCD2110358.1 hypothetical protein [Rhodococcus rhodochrous]QHG80878.1 hypothetical protein D1O33_02180 [Rhodococcus rhodochrous]QOH55111.1 hypothetical protein C6Y44_03395 [Rhodococcus rhodochrous]WAL47182.1 hypothetical protein OQN32_03535 [Rhodococcus pyridinivorans]